MDDLKLTLTEHLEELRSRLWRVILVVLGLGGLALYFARDLFGLLMAPVLAALPAESRALVYTSGIEEINVLLKVGLYAGIFLSTPVALYQLWQFVAPGLLPKERKFVGPFVAFGTLFFVGGALFCYLLVLPTMFEFLLRPGEAGPLRDRIALVRPQADDAVRLLMLGDLQRAQQLAGAVEELLARSGDGQTAAPQAVSSSKTELAERLAQLGHLLDLEVAAPGDASRRAALGEAITRRAEAQLLFEQGALPAASAKLEDGVAAIGNAHPGAGAAVLTVWSAEKHLSAAKGRLTDQEWTRPMLSMKEQLSLVLLLEVAFGAIFELPLIMALLSIVGLLKFAFVARYQRHAILACVVLAAIITPSGDAVNLGLMALPMIFCFELGVLLVFLLEKRRPAAPATSPPAT